MTKHWALQDAKARLSELVRAAEKEPQIITYRGKPKVEVRAVETEGRQKPKSLADALLAAPRVPEFRLPPRKREKPRKLDL
jgi:prevent-host-death family protein